MRILTIMVIGFTIAMTIVGSNEHMYTTLAVISIVLALLTIADVLSDAPKTKG